MERLPRCSCVAVLVVGLSLATSQASSPEPRAGLESAKGLMSELEAALSAPCDPSLFASSIDFDRLVRRGIEDLEAAEPIKQKFTEGIEQGFDLASAICNDVNAGGSYTLLSLREIDGRPQALFRLISVDGVNYHDLLLERGDRLQIVDVFVHSNGEWISQLVRRGFLPVAARFGGGTKDENQDADTLYLDNVQTILTMIQHYREGRYEEALDVFHSLPAELKTNRNILMQRFAIAVKVGGKPYDAAMADLKTAFPDDPSLGLVLIDYHFNRGEYEKSLEIIDRLDRQLGGDPYLDFFRANVFYVAGRLDKAKKAARRAIKAEPTLEDPYWTLVTISLDEKQFTETARLLTEIETALGLLLGDLGGVPEYEEFVRSDVYAAWAIRHEGD